jgi:hypothetical protein
MANETRKDRFDPDGVRITEHKSGRPLAPWFFAIVAVVVGAILYVRLTDRGPDTPATPHAVIVRPKVPLPEQPASDSSSRPGAARQRQLRAVHVDRAPRTANDAPAKGQANEPGQRANDDPETVQQRQIEDVARSMIDAAKQAGETGGVAAFPSPGTDPIKMGLVVPDDFELPDGYIRHYQTTDDGRRLEPILMFSPDYDFVDENGQPVPLPESGIVPPEMAPPGMPIRTLEMPSNPYGGLGAR